MFCRTTGRYTPLHARDHLKTLREQIGFRGVRRRQERYTYLVSVNRPFRKLWEYARFARRTGKLGFCEDVEHRRGQSPRHHLRRHHVNETVQIVDVTRALTAQDARSVSQSYVDSKIKMGRVVVALGLFVVPASQYMRREGRTKTGRVELNKYYTAIEGARANIFTKLLNWGPSQTYTSPETRLQNKKETII